MDELTERLDGAHHAGHGVGAATRGAVEGSAPRLSRSWATSEGNVTAIRLLRNELGEPEAGGRKPFRVLPGTEFEIPADCVFLALGFEPVPLPALARDNRGLVVEDEEQMTSLPGVFAGGDLVHGPSTVLEVVRDPRCAAQAIEDFLADRLERRPPATA